MAKARQKSLQGSQLELPFRFTFSTPTAAPEPTIAPGTVIVTASGRAIVTRTMTAGQAMIIFADYGSGVEQPHSWDSISLEPDPNAPPQPAARAIPESAFSQYSGWLEERLVNRHRRTPNRIYYYCWRDEQGKHRCYIPARKLYRIQHLVEVDHRPICEILALLSPAQAPGLL